MKNDCSKAQHYLKNWDYLQNEWNDKKFNEIEADFINPIQNLLIFINETIDEIYDLIAITEEEITHIKEES